MRRLAIVIVAAAILSCAQSPNEIRVTSERFEHVSAFNPKEAAACAGRAAEQENGNLRTQWREGAAPGTYELIGTFAGSAALVGDIRPAGAGSKIDLFVQRDLMYFVRDALLNAIRRAC